MPDALLQHSRLLWVMLLKLHKNLINNLIFCPKIGWERQASVGAEFSCNHWLPVGLSIPNRQSNYTLSKIYLTRAR